MNVSPDAAQATDSRCPRCGGEFHCGVNDARPCACSSLQLSAAQLADLNARFGHLAVSGAIDTTMPLRDEQADNDRLELARLKFRFVKRRYGELRRMIDAINDWVPATSSPSL